MTLRLVILNRWDFTWFSLCYLKVLSYLINQKDHKINKSALGKSKWHRKTQQKFSFNTPPARSIIFIPNLMSARKKQAKRPSTIPPPNCEETYPIARMSVAPRKYQQT